MDYQTEHNNYQNAGPQDGGAKKRGAGDKQEEDDGQAFWNRTVQDADYEDQFDPYTPTRA
jgi:hypothetical protein